MSSTEQALRSTPTGHDPRCRTLTDSEFNDVCDCRTLRTIDSFQQGER